jgi:hypothetical protein
MMKMPRLILALFVTVILVVIAGWTIYLPVTQNNYRNFSDSFMREGLIVEGKMDESSDPNWWVNSGAYLYLDGKVAKTIQGELPANDPRRISYSQENPGETDNGYHPQNIFRLVLRTKWQNYSQQVYFKINRYILSPDPHRQPSNGLLLFNHYQDGQNLYYAGLRVDGYVDIKKKINGTYYTVGLNQVLPGDYNRDTNPNLIPINKWIGIKTEVLTKGNAVSIKLFTDIGRTGKWTQVLGFEDTSNQFGGPPITQAGYAGIRTDFMDVEFSDYSISGG